MAIGLPRKKMYFKLLKKEDELGSCFFWNEILVIYKGSGIDNLNRAFDIKLIDLDNFSGCEDSVKPIYQVDNIRGTYLMSFKNGYVSIGDEERTCISLESGERIISNKDSSVPIYWNRKGGGVVSGLVENNKYYCQLSGHYGKTGCDIYCLENKRIIGNVDTDFISINFQYGDMIGGIRKSDNFAIFSLSKNKFIFELDTFKYFSVRCEERKRFIIRTYDHKVCLALFDSIVIIDLTLLKVVVHVNCLANEEINKLSEKYNSSKSTLRITDIHFSEDSVILSGGRRISYVMSINIKNGGFVRWVRQFFDPLAINYIGGDLAFGIIENVPVGWDVYSGEIIWKGNSKCYGNRVHIGGNWVAFSAFYSGPIHCYKWKRIYLSPHRSI